MFLFNYENSVTIDLRKMGYLSVKERQPINTAVIYKQDGKHAVQHKYQGATRWTISGEYSYRNEDAKREFDELKANSDLRFDFHDIEVRGQPGSDNFIANVKITGEINRDWGERVSNTHKIYKWSFVLIDDSDETNGETNG